MKPGGEALGPFEVMKLTPNERRDRRAHEMESCLKFAKMHEEFAASYAKQGDTELAEKHKALIPGFLREAARLKTTL